MREARAHVEMHFDTSKEAEVLYQALSVESRSSKRDRADVNLSLEDKRLCLDICASDVVAFRAAMNSYSRWIRTSKDLMDDMKNNRRQGYG